MRPDGFLVAITWIMDDDWRWLGRVIIIKLSMRARRFAEQLRFENLEVRRRQAPI